MAHRIKVETVAALNKDGSPSKVKKVHQVWHRGRRGGKKLIAVCTNKKDLEIELRHTRLDFLDMHLAKHPNDMAFRRKHNIPADA